MPWGGYKGFDIGKNADMKKATPWKKALAVYMSRNKSWPEKKLWAELRDNKLGVRIYAQKVLLFSQGYLT